MEYTGGGVKPVEEQMVDAGGASAQAETDAPMIDSENLFDLVDSGAISLEEANAFLEGSSDDSSLSGGENESFAGAAQEQGVDGGEVPPNAVENPVQRQEVDKPFRVFKTEEEFQSMFDNAWNKRYGKMKSEQEARDKERDSLLSDLGEILGVPKEDAQQELAKRKLLFEAQRNGVENPESYAAVKSVENERDALKAQLEQQAKREQQRAIVGNIRACGAKITGEDPSFDIDAAMEMPEFANIVFSLYNTMPDRAVEIAYRTCLQKTKPQTAAVNAAAPMGDVQRSAAQMRPVEGGLAGSVNGERKPVDFSRMSDKDILKIQERVLRGEKVDF